MDRFYVFFHSEKMRISSINNKLCLECVTLLFTFLELSQTARIRRTQRNGRRYLASEGSSQNIDVNKNNQYGLVESFNEKNDDDERELEDLLKLRNNDGVSQMQISRVF